MNAYTPDILASHLDVVFCGINPATSAATAGHNFSNRSNRFWSVLHLSGFTDRRLEPQDEHLLLKYRCGITAVVDRPTKRASEVMPEEFRQAQPGFESKIRRHGPRSLAFLGKRAFSAMTNQSIVAWGPQSTSFAGTAVWILPNPSGLNRGFSLEALVKAYSEFRMVLTQSVAIPLPN